MRPTDPPGHPSDHSERLQLAYDELHRLARRALSREAPGHTLQTTALLHEAWLRLEQADGEYWSDREHFLAVAATAMRSVLIDHARKRQAVKRGGNAVRLELDGLVEELEERAFDLMSLDEALRELSQVDAELARVVELRFFGGLSHPEIAKVTGRSLRSIERGWSSARTWLHTRLAADA